MSEMRIKELAPLLGAIVSLVIVIGGALIAWGTLLANDKHHTESVAAIESKNDKAIVEMRQENRLALQEIRSDNQRRDDHLTETLDRLGVKMQANREDIIRLWAQMDGLAIPKAPPKR